MATGLEKVRFHSNLKERQCPKHSNYHKIALISHASKAMLSKFSKPGFNSTQAVNFQMFKLDLGKAQSSYYTEKKKLSPLKYNTRMLAYR